MKDKKAARNNPDVYTVCQNEVSCYLKCEYNVRTQFQDVSIFIGNCILLKIAGVEVDRQSDQVVAKKNRKRKSSGSLLAEEDSADRNNSNKASLEIQGPPKKKKKKKKKKGKGDGNDNLLTTTTLSTDSPLKEPERGQNIDKERPSVSDPNGNGCGVKKDSVAMDPDETTTVSEFGKKKPGMTQEETENQKVEKRTKRKKEKASAVLDNVDHKPNEGKETQVLAKITKSKKTENCGEGKEARIISLDSLFGGRRMEDSVKHGKDMFQWLIDPIPIKKFMKDHWEKKPLHIKRSCNNPNDYTWILSSSDLDMIIRLRNTVFTFGKDIEITSCRDGEIETYNNVGRAFPAPVWNYYASGCSVKFLNLETYTELFWHLNASLQVFCLRNSAKLPCNAILTCLKVFFLSV